MAPDSRRPSDYEQEALQAIQRWERQEISALTKLGRLATRPVEWATETFVPKQLQAIAGDSLYRLLTHANDAVHLTIKPEPMLRQVRAAGHDIEIHQQLRGYDLPISDVFARKYGSQHIMLTAASGGVLGLGGLALAAVDIPALFTTNLRMIQHIAMGYGYDLSDPVERHFALQLFQAAAGDPQRKVRLLQELTLLRSALERTALSEVASSSAMAATLQGLRRMAQKVGIEVTERKLLVAVPLIGAGIGAGFNYLFTREVAKATSMGYRKRWLAEKYPDWVSTTVEGETD